MTGRRVVARAYQNLDETQVAAEHALLAALAPGSRHTTGGVASRRSIPP